MQIQYINAYFELPNQICKRPIAAENGLKIFTIENMVGLIIHALIYRINAHKNNFTEDSNFILRENGGSTFHLGFD